MIVKSIFMFQSKSLCVVRGIDQRSVSIQTLDMTHAVNEDQYYHEQSAMETCHLENENTLSRDNKQQQVSEGKNLIFLTLSQKLSALHFLVNKAKYMDRGLLCIKLKIFIIPSYKMYDPFWFEQIYFLYVLKLAVKNSANNQITLNTFLAAFTMCLFCVKMCNYISGSRKWDLPSTVKPFQ